MAFWLLREHICAGDANKDSILFDIQYKTSDITRQVNAIGPKHSPLLCAVGCDVLVPHKHH